MMNRFTFYRIRASAAAAFLTILFLPLGGSGEEPHVSGQELTSNKAVDLAWGEIELKALSKKCSRESPIIEDKGAHWRIGFLIRPPQRPAYYVVQVDKKTGQTMLIPTR